VGAGMAIRYLDIGGGLGVRYKPGDLGLDPREYVRKIVDRVRTTGFTIMLEPGRSIVAEAGAILTRVVNCKTNGNKNFVIVDAAMNDLIRPALYAAHHEILPVKKPVGAVAKKAIVADIVGPVCETGDFLARDRKMHQVAAGDLLAIATTGAYGSVLGSNYNARLRPPEILLDGSRAKVIRKRETLTDLVRNES
jgi:diaminopimelate decarboxylase